MTENTDTLSPVLADLKAKSLGERLAEIISDEEVAKVHGYANFGSMTPREVVNDGVRKTAVGYHCGHTQFTILREHGLITAPRTGSYDANLTKKGKAYARALYHDETATATIQALTARAEKAEALAKANEHDAQVWMAHAEKAEQQRDSAMVIVRKVAGLTVQGQDHAQFRSKYPMFAALVVTAKAVVASVSPNKSEADNG